MSIVMTSLTLAGTRDPGSTRLVYGIVISLVVLGVGLALFAVWLIRTTRPDRELLAPLEALQGRRWRRLDPAGRRRLLDELRPIGAQPEHPAPLVPEPDAEFGDELQNRDVRELGAPDDVASPAESPSEEPTGVVGEVGLASDEALPAATGPRAGDWDRWDSELGLRTVADPPSGEPANEASGPVDEPSEPEDR